MKNPLFSAASLRRHSGFTLLEIMLVVTIIALLLASGIYFMKGQFEFSQGVRVEGDIRAVSGQLKLYQAMNGFYPSTSQGLEALLTRPTTEPRPKKWRALFEQMPMDPWQEPYEYVQPGKHNPSSFDLFSKGPDRKAGTEDDVGNWSTES